MATMAARTAATETTTAICHPAMPPATTVWVRVRLGLVAAALDDPPEAGARKANVAGVVRKWHSSARYRDIIRPQGLDN